MSNKILVFIGMLVFIDICWFGAVNVGQTVDYNYIPFFKEFQVDAGMMIFFMAMYSALGTYLICLYFMKKCKQQLDNYKDEKIKKLEEKIK